MYITQHLGIWVNGEAPAPITSLDSLADVNIVSANSGDFLKWDGLTWINDPINLATDTVGNYMVDVSAGTGISVTHNPGEGSTATIAVGASVVQTTDTGTVTSTMIANGTITNADINDYAYIAISKLATSTTQAIGVGTIELGHANDTTLARGESGRLTVEGVNVVTTSSVDTLTNKTLVSTVLDSPTLYGSVSGITPSMVGLGEVNNTSDADKPVSTAQQAALDLKANLASPTFTGTVTVDNFVVNGTTTTINSTTITVDDINLELGSTTTPSNTTADGGGITLKGTTDKTFNWINTTSAWTSSEHLALSSGKNVLLNGSTSGTITLKANATAGTTTITLPATSGTVITTGDSNTVTETMLATGPARAAFRSVINAQTGTSYTLVLEDLAKLITMDNTSSMTLTVPLGVFEIGDRIDLCRKGTGSLTVSGASGAVTINATPGTNLRARWSTATLVQIDTNTWVLFGDLSA